MPKTKSLENRGLKKKRLIFFSAVALFFLSIIAIVLLKREDSSIQKDTFRIEINEQQFQVKIADTKREIQKGLMNVESMPENEGMLFVYPEKGYRTFWMKNTLIPLDIIFLDEKGRIVHIFHQAQPCTNETCTHYRCEKRAQYVIELNGGISEKYNFNMGDHVDLSQIPITY